MKCKLKYEFYIALYYLFANAQDNSLAILQKWRPILEGKGVTVIIGGHTEQKPKGGTVK